HFLHGDFRRRDEAVVLMGRTTGPAARPVQCFTGDQVRRIDIVGDVSEYGARPVIFADRFLDGFLGGYMSRPAARLAGGSGDGDLRRAVETGQVHTAARRDVDHRAGLLHGRAPWNVHNPGAVRAFDGNAHGAGVEIEADFFFAAVENMLLEASPQFHYGE